MVILFGLDFTVMIRWAKLSKILFDIKEFTNVFASQKNDRETFKE